MRSPVGDEPGNVHTGIRRLGEVEAPGIHVLEVMRLCSRWCDWSVKKNHPPTANFVVSVARGLEVPWRVLSPSSTDGN
jgi:hypothetical protein